MGQKQSWWFYAALPMEMAHCVAAGVVYLNALSQANLNLIAPAYDGPIKLEPDTRLLAIAGINLFVAIALLMGAAGGVWPPLAFRPPWTYFRHMPRWMQAIYLLGLMVLIQTFAHVVREENILYLFDMGLWLAQLRLVAALWLFLSLNTLLPLLYWGWVVPRQAGRAP